jgi:AraC-like DNA-binding protein
MLGRSQEAEKAAKRVVISGKRRVACGGAETGGLSGFLAVSPRVCSNGKMSNDVVRPAPGNATQGLEPRHLRSADVDEARSIGTALYYPHRLRVADLSADFRMRVDAFDAGPLTVGTIEYNTNVRVETQALDVAYHLNVPLEGQLRTSSGKNQIIATPQRAALYRRDQPTVIEGWDRHCRMLAIKFPRGVLEAHLGTLIGKPVTKAIAFEPSLDLMDPWAREWWSFMEILIRQLENPNSLVRNPMMLTSIADSVMTGLLLSSDHQYRPDLEALTPGAAPAAVRKAVEMMESSPEQHTTVADLAAACGVGVRSLQTGFKSTFEMSPLAYLREIRLLRAQRELLSGTPETSTVAEVASTWGFSHLGRFAADYAARFGELPSDTLRR